MEDFKEKLITEVRKRSLIWEKCNPRHSKRNEVNVAWEEVAKEMQSTPEVCKKKWKSLTDNFRTNVKLLPPPSSGSGLIDVESIKWKYFKMLLFTHDSQVHRASVSNLSVQEDASPESLESGCSSWLTVESPLTEDSSSLEKDCNLILNTLEENATDLNTEPGAESTSLDPRKVVSDGLIGTEKFKANKSQNPPNKPKRKKGTQQETEDATDEDVVDKAILSHLNAVNSALEQEVSAPTLGKHVDKLMLSIPAEKRMRLERDILNILYSAALGED